MASGIIPKYADGTDTGWVSVEGSSSSTYLYTGTIKYRAIGKIVNVVASGIHLTTAMTSGSYRTIAPGILSAYAPAEQAIVIGGNSNVFTQISVSTSGSVNFYRKTGDSWATTDNINFNLFYMAA